MQAETALEAIVAGTGGGAAGHIQVIVDKLAAATHVLLDQELINVWRKYDVMQWQ